jgi:hypothetical protein
MKVFMSAVIVVMLLKLLDNVFKLSSSFPRKIREIWGCNVDD